MKSHPEKTTTHNSHAVANTSDRKNEFQTPQLKQMAAVPVLQTKPVVQLKLNRDDALALYQYYEQHYINTVPWAIWEPYHRNIVNSNVELAEACEDVDRQIAALPPAPAAAVAAPAVADAVDAAPDGEAVAEEAAVDVAPSAAAASSAPARPSFASLAASIGGGRAPAPGARGVAMAPPVRPVAVAPAPAAAAPAALGAGATPADVFQAADPARFRLSGGKRRTLAGTLWFKVLYGDRAFSLHIHVNARGTIQHTDDKIKNRGGVEYYVNLSSAANAAVRALNPFP